MTDRFVADDEIKVGTKVCVIGNPGYKGTVRNISYGKEGRKGFTVESRGGYVITTDADRWWIMEETEETQNDTS